MLAIENSVLTESQSSIRETITAFLVHNGRNYCVITALSAVLLENFIIIIHSQIIIAYYEKEEDSRKKHKLFIFPEVPVNFEVLQALAIAILNLLISTSLKKHSLILMLCAHFKYSRTLRRTWLEKFLCSVTSVLASRGRLLSV